MGCCLVAPINVEEEESVPMPPNLSQDNAAYFFMGKSRRVNHARAVEDIALRRMKNCWNGLNVEHQPEYIKIITLTKYQEKTVVTWLKRGWSEPETAFANTYFLKESRTSLINAVGRDLIPVVQSYVGDDWVCSVD